jgi:hypothetical protein
MARKVENFGIGATFYNNRSKCHIYMVGRVPKTESENEEL